MTKEKRFSVREAIADAFGFDFADVENDYRYQPGPNHTPCAVYSIGEDYYTATKSPSVKPKEGHGYHWVPETKYTALHGWQVWKATRDE